jgi:replicative DNA helicase Mcm
VKQLTSSPERWQEFFQRYMEKEVKKLCINSARPVKTLVVDYGALLRYSEEIAEELVLQPDKVLQHARSAFAALDTCTRHDDYDHQVQVTKLPRKTLIRDMRASDVGHLLALDVVVVKQTYVRPIMVQAAFECQRCRNVIMVAEAGDGSNAFAEPVFCVCNETKKARFLVNEEISTFKDYQRIKVQESYETIPGGDQPQTLTMEVYGDLCGLLHPGQHLIVNGVLKSSQRMERNRKNAVYDLYFFANSFELNENEYESIVISSEEEAEIKKYAAGERGPVDELIVDSIAPSIYGYGTEKLALGLQMFSGVTIELPDGTRIRGDGHILLVGDRGIAKTGLLRYIVKQVPKGIYVNGKNATEAGLTAVADKDQFAGEDGSWTLKAGAMVLADKGVLCLDEADKMAKWVQDCLLEPMEQQTVSIAKAGMTTTMPCRNSMVVAANPKDGVFDATQAPIEQIEGFSQPFMNRFDLIFILYDKPDKQNDALIAGHILGLHTAGEQYMRHMQQNPTSKTVPAKVRELLKDVTPPISPEMLRKWVAYAKKHCTPVLSKEASSYIEQVYVEMRTGRDSWNVTPRQLEAIIRFSCAAARMELQEKVELRHAKKAVEIVRYSLSMTCRDPRTGKVDVDALTIGITKDQRSRKKAVLTMIAELCTLPEYEAGVPLEKLLAALQERYKLPAEQAEKELKKFKEIGEVFEPKAGLLKVS